MWNGSSTFLSSPALSDTDGVLGKIKPPDFLYTAVQLKRLMDILCGGIRARYKSVVYFTSWGCPKPRNIQAMFLKISAATSKGHLHPMFVDIPELS